MKLARHARLLLTVHGYPEHLLLDPQRLRETLAFHGVTPSRGQVRAALRKHLLFILTGQQPDTRRAHRAPAEPAHDSLAAGSEYPAIAPRPREIPGAHAHAAPRQ